MRTFGVSACPVSIPEAIKQIERRAEREQHIGRTENVGIPFTRHSKTSRTSLHPTLSESKTNPRKPNSVPTRKQVTAIYLSALKRIPAETGCDYYPGLFTEVIRTGGPFSLLCLAPHGVYPASAVTFGAVSSYLTISPLPTEAGGIFSVALSVGHGLTRNLPGFHRACCLTVFGLSSRHSRKNDERPSRVRFRTSNYFIRR